VTKLAKEKYPIWKKKFRQVLIAMKAYNIINSVELLPVGNSIALSPLLESRHD
jgi:hypothetical protein